MYHKSTKQNLPRFKLKKSVTALSAVLISTMGSSLALAQETDSDVALEEVIVTGSLIRGAEVVGSQTISLGAQEVTDLGAATTNEIMASIPQISNFFNSRPEEDPRGSTNISISRPNLRNMPGFNSASGSVTLLLMDGHRIAPVGVFESTIDADLFAGNTIENIGIVTDGGSSLYGADAVAGVINFMTKSQQDGVELNVDLGSGDDYGHETLSLSAGTSWSDGSIFASISTSSRDEVLNADRDWAGTGTYDPETSEFTPKTATTCIDPVRTNYGWFNYGAGWTNNPAAPGAGPSSAGDPTCDQFSSTAMVPEQERNNLFLSYKQQLSSNVELGVKSYYSERSNTYSSYPLGSVAPPPFDVAGTSPANLDAATIAQFNLPDPATVGPGQVYTYPNGAGFSYGAHSAYRDRQQEIEMSTWGIAPELTIDLENGWQVRNTLYYGRSDNTSVRPGTNEPKMGDYVRSGALNPLDVASADASVINDILNFESANRTIHELFLARVVTDGAVLELPAGELRIAAGFEVTQDRVRTRSIAGEIGALGSLDNATASRDNTAAFMEVAVPVIENLDVSFSIRHDDYSDFGSTTNPQLGFSFTPNEKVKIYGHWGESFNAPTALDTLAISNGRYVRLPQVYFTLPDQDVYGEYDGEGDLSVILEGSSSGLEPQTAESWAVGFELQPIDGLTVAANYYNIDFSNILGQLAQPNPTVRRNNPDKFIWDVSPERWAAVLDQVANPSVFDGVVDPANPNASIGFIYDRVTTNFSEAELEGLDFSVAYTHSTGLGQVSYGVNGNYQLDFMLNQGGTVTDNLAFNPDLTLSANIGLQRDNLRARLTMNYTDKFDASGAINQTSIDSFLVTKLFVGYDFNGSDMFTKDLSVRFSIDNLFDEEPPEYRRNAEALNFSGFTFGRVFKIGFTKSFD